MKNIVSKVVEDGKESVIKSGYDTEETSFKSDLIMFRNKTRSEMFHFFNGTSTTLGERYTDNAAIMNAFHVTHKIKNGETKVLPPKFIIFSELELTEPNLSDLQNVRF